MPKALPKPLRQARQIPARKRPPDRRWSSAAQACRARAAALLFTPE
jgi:hypothetical protein